MAQNYEIDIKRFNGQDYDTLLPTPATHAGTHQADGSDPITVKTGNIENGAVTRAKLAQDALVSPFKFFSGNSYTIAAEDIGRTIMNSYTSGDNNEKTVNLTYDVSHSLPMGTCGML